MKIFTLLAHIILFQKKFSSSERKGARLFGWGCCSKGWLGLGTLNLDAMVPIALVNEEQRECRT
jgi:hypothetical protein